MSFAAAIAAFLLLSAAAVAISVRATRQPGRRPYESSAELRAGFAAQRARLEEQFLIEVRRSGKPRGLSWQECQFQEEVLLARDKQSGCCRALVAVTIRFAAIEGCGMEQVEAVADLRAATAVCYREGVRWTTDGRVCFNLTPAETLQHFAHELEPLP